MRISLPVLCLAVLAATSGSSAAVPIIGAPSILDCGNTMVGASATQTLNIQNTGNATLTVATMVISGSSQFEFDSPPSVPFNVAPGGQVSFTTVFSPTSRGIKQATLTISSNDPVTPSKNVALRGTGVAPVIAVASGSIDFGDVLLPGSADRALSISNTGEVTLVLNNCTLTGPDSSSFSLVSTLPLSVAPGYSTSISVRFAPASEGLKSATLHLDTNDPITPDKTISLSGNGLDLLDVQDAGLTAFTLAPPTPNPVVGGTNVTFTLPAAANTLLEIFDGQGRRVRTLLRGAWPAGRQSVRWDGRDDCNGTVQSGVYFLRLSSAGHAATARFALLR